MIGEEFAEALAVVLRDLRAQCSVQPEVREDEEYPGVILYAPDGSGQGVYGEPDGRPAAALLVAVADQVQDWAVEALWGQGESAVWPHCPAHPGSHPLAATLEGGAAVWSCPASGVPAGRIGGLPPADVADVADVAPTPGTR